MGVRFAQLVHELQPRIRALQITQFMCSAWMKPVCIHTMGHDHKTVNASPILADLSVWRSFYLKARIFHQSPVSFICACHSWIYVADMRFISLYFKQIPLCSPNTQQIYPWSDTWITDKWITGCRKARSKVLQSMDFISLQCKGCYTPGSCIVPALLSLSLSRPLHFSTMQIRSDGRSKAQRAAHKVIWSTPAVGSSP